MARSRGQPVPTRPLGHVDLLVLTAPTSAVSIAMALVAGGRARSGQTLYVPDRRGGEVAVR